VGVVAAQRVVSVMPRNDNKTFSIEFAETAQAPPADLLARAHEVLLGVADSLRGIPARSALWRAMDAGNAELNLAGWRFEYRVHHRDRRIVVVDARRAEA
jgi:hypothetical protein